MSSIVSDYFYLFAAIIFGVISQILFRYKTLALHALPDNLYEKVTLLIKMVFTTPLLLLGMFLTFLSGIFWLLTLTKFELSYAYPFTGLAFVLIISIDVFFWCEF